MATWQTLPRRRSDPGAWSIGEDELVLRKLQLIVPLGIALAAQAI